MVEGVIKSLTVRDLITPCIQGSYRNRPFIGGMFGGKLLSARLYGGKEECRMQNAEAERDWGQPKLGNLRPGLVEFTPPTKKARPSAPGSIPPRIMRNARNGEKAKPPVRSECQSTHLSRS